MNLLFFVLIVVGLFLFKKGLDHFGFSYLRLTTDLDELEEILHDEEFSNLPLYYCSATEVLVCPVSGNYIDVEMMIDPCTEDIYIRVYRRWHKDIMVGFHDGLLDFYGQGLRNVKDISECNLDQREKNCLAILYRKIRGLVTICSVEVTGIEPLE